MYIEKKAVIPESLCNDAYNTIPDIMALLCTSVRCSIMYANHKPLPREYLYKTTFVVNVSHRRSEIYTFKI